MLPILQSVVAVGVASIVSAARRAVVAATGLIAAAALLVMSLAFFTIAAHRALSHSLGDVVRR